MAEEMIKGKKRLDDISATQAKEVLEPAMEEDREELQKIWAALLARIMVEKNNGIRAEIIDLIKKFNPIDVLVLEQFATYSRVSNLAHLNSMFISDKIREKYDVLLTYDRYDFMISFEFLYKNKLITYPSLLSSVDLSFFEGKVFGLSDLGKKILKITSPPTSE